MQCRFAHVTEYKVSMENELNRDSRMEVAQAGYETGGPGGHEAGEQLPPPQLEAITFTREKHRHDVLLFAGRHGVQQCKDTGKKNTPGSLHVRFQVAMPVSVGVLWVADLWAVMQLGGGLSVSTI